MRVMGPAARGSPFTIWSHAGLAQLVEHPPCKRKVFGSIPKAGTTPDLRHAGVVKVQRGFMGFSDVAVTHRFSTAPGFTAQVVTVALALAAATAPARANPPALASVTSATAPTSASGGAFAFRDAADGVSCAFFDGALGLHWPDAAISWADAGGRLRGGRPYDVQTLEARQPPNVLRWNVLPLVHAWASGAADNEGLVVAPLPDKNNKVGGGADFHSREAADVGLRPSLRVQHPSGAVEFLSPQADAHLDCSTAAGLGTREVLHIGPSSLGVLRFDLGRLRKGPALAAVAAELILVRNAAVGVWSDGALGVFRLKGPWSQPMPAPERGLAATYSRDQGIEAHPAVLWADNFSSARLKPGWNVAQLVGARVMPPLAVPDAGNQILALASLQATVPRQENLGLDLRFDLPLGPNRQPVQEAYLRYYLRVGPEWTQAPDSGKFPGLAGTYNKVGWGGRGWNGQLGWSARGAFTKSVPPSHPAHGRLALASYVYHSKITSAYGDMMVWGGGQGAGLIKPNRWVSVEQHVRLNTPGKEDGVLRAWVDGVPVLVRNNLRFRDTLQVGIENAWFDLYMGGQQPAVQDMTINIAQVVVATRYIGPMAP